MDCRAGFFDKMAKNVSNFLLSSLTWTCTASMSLLTLAAVGTPRVSVSDPSMKSLATSSVVNQVRLTAPDERRSCMSVRHLCMAASSGFISPPPPQGNSPAYALRHIRTTVYVRVRIYINWMIKNSNLTSLERQKLTSKLITAASPGDCPNAIV